MVVLCISCERIELKCIYLSNSGLLCHTIISWQLTGRMKEFHRIGLMSVRGIVPVIRILLICCSPAQYSTAYRLFMNIINVCYIECTYCIASITDMPAKCCAISLTLCTMQNHNCMSESHGWHTRFLVWHQKQCRTLSLSIHIFIYPKHRNLSVCMLMDTPTPGGVKSRPTLHWLGGGSVTAFTPNQCTMCNVNWVRTY